MLTIVLIAVVSGALLLGAAWGIFGWMPDRLEGALIALAGGALLLSAVLELIEPASLLAPFWAVALAVMAGAAVFAVVDALVDRRWGGDSGRGLLVAITLDGVPENIALGVALIGSAPVEVAALAGSIFLSNLPEAAGGARQMAGDDGSRGRVFGTWAAAAVLLSGAAIAGNFLLAEAADEVLALIRAFAGGAVVGSLATEVFPTAFRKDHQLAAIATTAGLILALFLHQLA